jgi:hypothetical protein
VKRLALAGRFTLIFRYVPDKHTIIVTDVNGVQEAPALQAAI